MTSLQRRGNMIALKGDITSKDSLKEIVSIIESQRGYINLLVNNSGIFGPWYTVPKPAAGESVKVLQEYLWNRATPEEFTNIFHVNVTGTWYTTIAFLHLLQEGNKAENALDGVTSQVVTVSSVGGFRR